MARDDWDRHTDWVRDSKCSRADIIRENLPHVLRRPDDDPPVAITELFFPPRDRTLYKPIADRAKAICKGKDGHPPCPVLAECLGDAVKRDELFGIFGGMSHRERNAMVRKLDKAGMTLAAFLADGGPV